MRSIEPRDQAAGSGQGDARFVLLEHTGHPDDPTGRHYDLLLEEPAACQTWRLADVPLLGGPSVKAKLLPPHRLAWLDIEAGEVSGGRGFARRIAAGRYELCPSEPAGPETAHAAALIRLTGTLVSGILEITTSGLATLR